MPIVPRIGSRVKSSAPPGVRVGTSVPEGTFGGDQQVGQAIRGLGNTVGGMILAERKRADDFMVKKSEANLTSWRNQFLANSQNRLGESSFTLPDEMRDEYESKIQEINEGLQNDNQRALFSNFATDTFLDVDSKIQNHVAQQTFISHNKESEALINNQKQFASNNFGDLKTIADSKNSIIKTIESLGESNGWSKQQVEAKKFDELSAMHIGVVQNLIVTDSDRAKDYYDANKEEINQSNMNSFDLDKNIKAFHKSNSEALQDSIYDKIISGDYEAAMNEVKVNAAPVVNGGIGSPRAKVLMDSIKKAQNDEIKEILEKEVDPDYGIYIDRLDKIVGEEKDKFAIKQSIVEAYKDSYFTKAEKSRIKKVIKIVGDMKYTQDKGWWFRKSYEDIKANLADLDDKHLANALGNLIDYASDLDRKPEEVEQSTKNIIRDERVSSNPKESSVPLGLFQNKKGAWLWGYDGSNGKRNAIYATEEQIRNGRVKK